MDDHGLVRLRYDELMDAAGRARLAGEARGSTRAARRRGTRSAWRRLLVAALPWHGRDGLSTSGYGMGKGTR